MRQQYDLPGLSIRWRLDRQRVALLRETREGNDKKWKAKGEPMDLVQTRDGPCKCGGQLMQVAGMPLLFDDLRVCWKCGTTSKIQGYARQIHSQLERLIKSTTSTRAHGGG